MFSVEIDYTQCDALIKLIQNAGGMPPDKEDPLPIELEPDTTKNFYMSVVAINHQTTPLVGQALKGISFGIERRGWDYLREKFLIATQKDPTLVSPERLAHFTAQDILQILKDEHDGGNITDSEGRAALLRNIGEVMLYNNWQGAQSLYNLSGGFLLRETKRDLLNLLARFDAFNDPLRKKSLYFLALMKNHGFWVYQDPENLGPPVNYHEARGHLRFGTVRILNNDLARRITAKEPVTEQEDLEIREAVFYAIKYISRKLNVLPSTAHYFFWNIFRNCCTRENPHCYGCASSCKLPERYQIILEKRCLFAESCEKRTELLEHNFSTNWY